MKSFFEHHGMEMFEAEEMFGEDSRPPLQCQRCGSTTVRWRQQGGRWVLFSLRPGVEHSDECTPPGAPASDFD